MENSDNCPVITPVNLNVLVRQVLIRDIVNFNNTEINMMKPDEIDFQSLFSDDYNRNKFVISSGKYHIYFIPNSEDTYSSTIVDIYIDGKPKFSSIYATKFSVYAHIIKNKLQNYVDQHVYVQVEKDIMETFLGKTQ